MFYQFSITSGNQKKKIVFEEKFGDAIFLLSATIKNGSYLSE